MTRKPRWVLTDLLFVLVLVGLAEAGLASTFAGPGHFVLAEVAAAVGLLLVLVTSRMAGAVLVAAVPIVALVLGGPLALRSAGFGGGVPDAETLGDVLRGAGTGWGELVTTLPWVDLSGPPALVPYLLAYFGAVFSGVLALRTRNAGGPLVPLLLVLAAALFLRRPGSTGTEWLDWYAVGFVLVSLVWFVLRSLREAPGAAAAGVGHGRFGRAFMAIVVVGLAVLVAIPVTVPLTSSGTPASTGAVLRGRSAALDDPSGLDSPLRRFRTFTEAGDGSLDNVHDKLLFTVDNAPEGSRVRMATLDTYDGREWLPSSETGSAPTQDAFLRMDQRVDNPNRGQRIRAQVSVTKFYRSAWVPTVGSLTSLQFLVFDPQKKQRDELRYNLATSAAVLPSGLGRDKPYEFTSILPSGKVGKSTPAWTGPGQRVEGLSRLDAFLPAVLGAPITPMEKVFVLAGYLHDQGRYSDGVRPGEERYGPGQNLDRLVDGFLLAGRPVGNDEQYAAAMALLANRVGVPARVVVGAVLPRDGKVRGEDVHAWVELRAADGSWRTLPTKTFMSRTPPLRTLPPAPPNIPPATTSPGQDQKPDTAATRDPADAKQTDEGRGLGIARRAAPFLLLLLLALVVPATKAVRRRLRRTRGRTSDRIAGGWAELVDRARDLGVPVEAHASRPAQARVLALSGADGLSHEADDGVFAAEEPSEAAVTAFWDQVMAERRELRGGQGLRRRLWAPFNPVTLWRRRRSLD